jgi:hypothetical protein
MAIQKFNGPHSEHLCEPKIAPCLAGAELALGIVFWLVGSRDQRSEDETHN